jgi:hypothetical protein
MLLGLLRARSSIGGWDPASIINGTTLSDSNKLATGEAGDDFSHVRSARTIVGNRYFSGVLTGDDGYQGIGVARDGAGPDSATNFLGENIESLGAWGADGIYLAGTRIYATTAAAFEFAIRGDDGRVWVRPAGGAWFGGGNPAINTDPTGTIAGTGAIRACCTVARATSTARLHSAAETTGTPPAGFSVGL